MSSDQNENLLARYRELLGSNPEMFDNPADGPIKLLFEEEEIKKAQRDARALRKDLGWPTGDLRVGVLAEDPYIGFVIRDAVQFSDGNLGLYNRVVASGGVVVLPILPDGGIALIRIFRHPARRWFLEAPQGFILPGAIPAEEARRELMEEIGAVANELISLGVVYTSTALTSENLKMFAAKISDFGDPQRSEGIESIHTIANEDIDHLLLDGGITDGPTMSLILRARIHGLL